MLRTFRSRSLKAFWNKGDASGLTPAMIGRLRRRLNALNVATTPETMNVPGFNFHKLRGKPVRFTIHVNGPWCVTFAWEGEDAVDVDLENYH